MLDGYIRAAAGTPEIRPADCAFNLKTVKAALDGAGQAGARLLTLPELCLTGYTCGDLFAQEALLSAARDSLARLLEYAGARHPDLIFAVGLPLRDRGKLYNCAAVAQGGRLLGVVPKTHLPNYGEFHEQRWFIPAPPDAGDVSLCGRQVPFGAGLLFAAEGAEAFTFGVEICEDLWAPAPVSVGMARAGAAVILNLSAGDEIIGKAAYRRALVTGQSARLLCGYVYASAGAGESTTDMVFSGHNLIAENGRLLAETPLFENGLIVADLDVALLASERQKNTVFRPPSGEASVCPARKPVYFTFPSEGARAYAPVLRPLSPTPFVPEDETGRQERCRSILTMQAHGLAARTRHTRAKALLVGVSGGLDSTLALLVAVSALDLLGRPRADALAVTMPCFGTTARTRQNAERLSRTLGASFTEVDIRESVTRHFRDIGHPEDLHDVVYENAQARERTQVLMDLANQSGGLAVGTADLSELALGWCTYNGDHMSMYAVNAGIPKTLVRYLVSAEAARYRGLGQMGLADTLDDVCATPITPELLPAENGKQSQETERLIGPYVLNDFFLYYAVRFGFRPRKVYRLARQAFAGIYSPSALRDALARFYERFFAQQFKRSCLPDGPKVGTVTLSPRGDWRMPSDASPALWLEEVKSLGSRNETR
jgi:NAD+ synthase (glutamine-hydrolysing)